MRLQNGLPAAVFHWNSSAQSLPGGGPVAPAASPHLSIEAFYWAAVAESSPNDWTALSSPFRRPPRCGYATRTTFTEVAVARRSASFVAWRASGPIPYTQTGNTTLVWHGMAEHILLHEASMKGVFKMLRLYHFCSAWEPPRTQDRADLVRVIFCKPRWLRPEDLQTWQRVQGFVLESCSLMLLCRRLTAFAGQRGGALGECATLLHRLAGPRRPPL